MQSRLIEKYKIYMGISEFGSQIKNYNILKYMNKILYGRYFTQLDIIILPPEVTY